MQNKQTNEAASAQSNVLAQKQNLSKAWVVCMVAALYFFYIFIQMTKFNAIGYDLMVDFKIGSTKLGTLSSIYFFGNVLFLIPAGLLLDRFSTKKILAIMTILALFCTFLFSFTNSVSSASWCFFLIGIAGAFAIMIPLRLASRWFPPEKMALVSGLIVTIGFLGAMVSQSPLTWLVSVVGWRHAMQWDALLGIFFLVLFLIFVRDYPRGVTREMTQEQATSIRFLWKSIKKAVANRQNWLFGIYTCLVNLPIFVFGAVFGARYLVQMHHLTESQAAFSNVLLFLGGMLGAPVYGWISDKLKLRKAPMYFGAIVTLILVLMIMYSSWGYATMSVMFFALGFFTSSQVITYPVISESNSSENIATGLSLGSILIMFGGAFLLPLFGWLLDLHWTGKMAAGIPVHSLSDYVFALWLLPISAIIAFIAIMLGKETRCKRIKGSSLEM